MKANLKFALGALAVSVIGCGGSGSGLLNQPQPRLRTINAVTGLPALDVKVGTTTVASNLPYGNVTPTYTIVPRGFQDVFFADSSSPTPPLFHLTKTFTFSDRLDAIAYGSPGATKVVLLVDSLLTGNRGSYRFFNASSANTAVDVFFTAPGGPLTGASTLTTGAVGSPNDLTTDYYSAGISAPKTYEIRVYPAGQDTGTPLVDQNVTLNPGDRKTYVILDPGSPNGNLLPIDDNSPG